MQDILLQVLGILYTTAHSHEIVVYTNSLALVLGNTSVGHAAGQFDQTLYSTERLGQGEQLGGLAEALGSGVAALDTEGQHTAAHTVAVLLQSNSAVRMAGKAGVVDSYDERRSLQGGGNGGSIGGGLPGAEVQGLETSVGQPGVEGRRDGADGVLEESQAILELVGVEGGDTHDDVAVAVDVLGDGVDDNVGAKVERVLDVGREEGVVDDDLDAAFVSLGDDLADVYQAEGRVAGGLNPDEAGVVGDVLGDVDLDLRREGDLDAVRLGDLGEVSVGATVDV